MSLAHCRIVLVETHYAGNLGATARVMRNMGLSDLVLVNPLAGRFDSQALQMSTHGETILRGARVVADLEAAIGDCAMVVGTSARTGGPVRRQSVGSPEQITPALASVLRAGQIAAIVFGPEPNGLTDETITRCHHIISIPADDEYPALNLAQAVAICLYELRKAVTGSPLAPREESASLSRSEWATVAEQERMFDQLRTALEEIHFLYGDKAEPLMHAVRHLLGRARLSQMEVKVLQGLARQIRWYVAHHPRTTGGSSHGATFQQGPSEP